MSRINQFTLALFLICCSALLVSAQAQTPRINSINVKAEPDKVRINAQGEVSEMRVEVSDEQGEVVFQSGVISGGTLDWMMTDAQGERVSPGTYLVTVTFHNAAGKLRKRVEQVTVAEDLKASTQAAASSTAPNAAQATITGSGTAGKIAKFTGAATIGNSVMTESAGKIGIGTSAPAQKLHLFGPESRLRLQSTASNRWTVAEYLADGRTWHTGVGGTTAPNDVKSKFYIFDATTNQFRMVIDTAGNVGIGTTNPLDAKLQVRSSSGVGVYGYSPNDYGVWGSSGASTGVYGQSANSTGVHGRSHGGTGVFGESVNGFAGYFAGNVHVAGTLSKGGGSFKIDHPLDPANKTLSHSFVESPDMMNIYNGIVTLDRKGQAVVVMPAYFNALNRDFRYQLTAIGQPGPKLYIAEKTVNNSFKIAGGKPGMEVSWQVTGIRKDAYAEAHRIPVEEDKLENERGTYLHPDAFNQPASKGIEQARRAGQTQGTTGEAAQAQASGQK